MTNEDLVQLLQQLSKQQVAKEIVDTQIKILGALYDKAISYTNLIIVAGYASFFAMWSFTKEYLSPRQALWAALLMSISIVTFVFFEIIKMTVTSRSLLARTKAVSDPAAANDPQRLLTSLREFELQSQRDVVRFGIFWVFALVACVSTAVLAIAILFSGFISSLIQTYT